MISMDSFPKNQTCFEKTINDRINRLLENWEGLSTENIMNEIDFFEYLNELDKRRIIKEITDSFFVCEDIKEKIEKYDRNFKEVTFEIPHHVSGRHLDLKYDNKEFWWYYRVPNKKKELWKVHYSSSL